MPPRTAADPSLDSREGDDHRAEGDALAGSAGAARGPEAAESLLDTVRGAPPDALEPLAVPALVARERLPEGALAAVPELQPALLQKSPALSEISPSAGDKTGDGPGRVLSRQGAGRRRLVSVTGGALRLR